MADIPARTELKVTTGPIRGSRKIHVGEHRVAMREIDLESSSGEPPLRVYDCSGPYTDPAAKIDIMAGLPELRRDWIRGRGDVEEVLQREVRPEDNGQLGPDRLCVARRRRLARDVGVEVAVAAARRAVRDVHVDAERPPGLAEPAQGRLRQRAVGGRCFAVGQARHARHRVGVRRLVRARE